MLLGILEYYGIRGTIKAWIEFYLTHRLQFVEIVKTDKENTNSYIILRIRKWNTESLRDQFWGPLLFLLYINALPLSIQDPKLALFVDYFNIIIIDKNIDTIQESLNRVMKQFGTWFSNNNLIITTDKT